MKYLILGLFFATMHANAWTDEVAEDPNYCVPELTATGSLKFDPEGNVIYTVKDCNENFAGLLEWIMELEDPEATVSIVGRVPMTANNFTGFYKGWPGPR